MRCFVLLPAVMVLATLNPAPGSAQATVAASPYRPSAENLEAREWFRDARFGIFIHWGVYSVLGRGEWVMNNSTR